MVPDQVTKIAVDGSGIVDLDELEKVLAFHDHAVGAPLVAVMAANNETGVIQPVEDIGRIVRANNGYFCVDAVQAFGKIAIDFNSLHAHFVLLSAHKIGGPMGVGALLRMEENVFPQPLIRGGGQENLSRAGTENVAAIAGFGEAIKVTLKNLTNRQSIVQLRDRIEYDLEEISRQAGNMISLPVFFGNSISRLDNTSCFAVEGIKAETAMIALDLEGIYISSGSACSSGRINQSHVLSAMGVDPDLAECTMRLSIGKQTSGQQANHFLDTWRNIVERRIAA